MSQIFDGLQRSEAERSGIDLSALSGVTELLQIAERRAAAKWETTTLSEQSAATKGTDREPPSHLQEVLPVATEVETSATATEPSPTDASRDLFSQFQSLPVSLSP